jgi:sugar/nucleoside kinase (ribokinase family)
VSFPAVVVYGTVALDRFYPTGRELPGGEAFNTALSLAGWGVPVALVGTTLGTDPEGVRLWQLLADTGLSCEYVPVDPRAVTPFCEITLAPDGERQMRGRGFAEAIAPPLPLELLRTRPIVAVDPNLGEAAVAMARAALAAGCRLVAMDFFRPRDIVEQATLLQCSPESLRRFQGPVGTPEDILTALPTPNLILTQGAMGGLVREHSALWRYHGLPLADICDTTGAGDTFRAGLCYGLWKSWSLHSSVLFASAAAACHCQRFGGASQVPLQEIQALMVKNSPEFLDIF